MLEDMFLTDTPTEASSSEVELDENMEKWPEEIQNMLMTQVPILNQVPGQLQFKAVDQDKLYAVGSYIIQADPEGKSNMAIPILIRDGKLQPTDLLKYNDDVLPLDSETIENILMSPALGDKLIDEQDIPASAYTGFSNRVTPPGAYGSGYVNSYANKTGELKENLTKIAESVGDVLSANPNLLVKIAEKAKTRKIVNNMLSAKSFGWSKLGSQKNELKELFKTDKVILNRGNGNFVIKSASICDDGSISTFEIPCSLYELTAAMKVAGLKGAKRILDDLKTTGMAFTWEDREASDDTVKKIDKLGSYECYDDSLKAHTMGVIGTVKTASSKPVYLAIDSENNYTVQPDLIGKPSSSVKVACTKRKPMVGDTIAVKLGATNEYIAPVKVTSVRNFRSGIGNGTTINGYGTMGKIAFVQLVCHTDPKAIQVADRNLVPKEFFTEKSASVWYIPNTQTSFIRLNKLTPLVKTAQDLHDKIFLMGGGHSIINRGSLWKSGNNTYAYRSSGNKTASYSGLTYADAAMILHQSGETNVAEEMKKIAAGSIKVIDCVKGQAGKAKFVESKTKNMGMNDRKRMGNGTYAKKPSLPEIPKAGTTRYKSAMLSNLKVAAALDDDETIDTVLSLNYVTPENMEEFKLMLPDLESAEKGLAKLLLSIRLGNEVADEEDVRKVLTSLHDTIKALKSRM